MCQPHLVDLDLRSVLRLADIVPATLKTAVFGLLIGLIGCWTGLRAATPDGLPLIGPHSARRGLWLESLSMLHARPPRDAKSGASDALY